MTDPERRSTKCAMPNVLKGEFKVSIHCFPTFMSTGLVGPSVLEFSPAKAPRVGSTTK